MIWVLLLFSALVLAFLYLVVWEPGKIRHKKIELSFDSLPIPFDGYTILFLSDIHFKQRDARKEKVLTRLARKKADLCVVTGDLIETDDSIETCCRALRGLNPVDGLFGVLGNHDYFQYTLLDTMRGQEISSKFNQVERLVTELAHTGLRMLRNESVEIPRKGSSIFLAGVDDQVSGRDDMPKALDKVPQEAFTILLSHTPDILKHDRPKGVHLVFAGHTHGGQIMIPFWGPLVNHSKLKPGFVSGRINIGDMVLVVSNGLGVNRLFPFRFRCRPEIYTVCLRRKGYVG